MAAVNFLVADGAIPVARGSQIVKCRRHNAQNDSTRIRRRQIRVAFEANQPDVLPDQHFCIGRAVRHMAALAALIAHGGMLEGEWPALVAVAVETARLIGVGHAHQAGLEAAVRIMAVDTGHRVFGNSMFERLSERRLYIDVAAFTQAVDVRGLACNQALRTMRVNRMALGAGDGVMSVAGVETAGCGWLISVTSQAGAIDFSGRQGCEIPDVGRQERLNMGATRPVARFAGLTLETMRAFAFVHHFVRTLCKGFPDVLVAHGAGFRANISGRGRGGSGFCRRFGSRLLCSAGQQRHE